MLTSLKRFYVPGHKMSTKVDKYEGTYPVSIHRDA